MRKQVMISADLHHRLKIRAAELNVTLIQLLERIIATHPLVAAEVRPSQSFSDADEDDFDS